MCDLATIAIIIPFNALQNGRSEADKNARLWEGNNCRQWYVHGIRSEGGPPEPESRPGGRRGRLDQRRDGAGRAGRLLPLRVAHLLGRGGELPGHQQGGRGEERGAAELRLQGQLHHDHLQKVASNLN